MKNCMNGRTVKAEHLVRLTRWLHDLSKGEMIEDKNYKKNYLGFKSISQNELDELCQLANTHLLDTFSGFFIGNSMGEIIPIKKAFK